MKPRKTLLIIDMQKASFAQPCHDAEQVVNRINKLASVFRELDLPVIHIQHDGTGMGEYEKNTTEWELLDAIVVKPTDIMFDKYANDAFYNSGFQSKLNELNAGDLYITGSATDFCVESTIQSALTKDYNVVVVEDGHTAGDRPHLKGEKIVEHYNWVWKNMIPTKGKIEVIKFDQIKATLQ